MILGIGCDLMALERMPPLPPEDPFLRKTFTERERREAAGAPDTRRYFATNFSGKEAVFKALRGDPDTFRLDGIEILREPSGAPSVALSGRAAALAAARGVRTVHLSLSWEDEYCMAFAVAEGEAVPAPPASGA